MPGLTPTFSIPYPCAGETIDPQVFQDFADAVDNALLTVQGLQNLADQRPSAASDASGSSVPVGAATPMTFDSNDFNWSITPIAAGFTVGLGGFYMVDFNITPLNSTTSVTSVTADILVGGSSRIHRKISKNPATASADRLNVSGLIQVPSATNVTFQTTWTGAGVNIVFSGRASLSMLRFGSA